MKSVRTALRVFEEVAARQPVGLSQLSRTLGVPKASVQRALATLSDAGWLRYDTNHPGQWVVTARFSVLTDVDPVLTRVRQVAPRHLRHLQELIRASSVGVFVLDGDRMVLLAGPGNARVVRSVEEMLGPLPVHRSAAGRAILALLPPEVRGPLLDLAIPPPGDREVVRHLEREIERARRRGFAVAAGEYFEDLGMVAAPIVAGGGNPVAGLTAVVPVGRLAGRGVAQLGRAVVETAQTISRSLDDWGAAAELSRHTGGGRPAAPSAW